MIARQFLVGALFFMFVGMVWAQPSSSGDPRDPWENYNRAMFQLNEGVDRVLLKPTAQAYTAVVPEPVRQCVGNIFGNIGDVWSAFNSLLQGKPGECVNQLMRVAVNTALGFGGCLDIAREMEGLEKRKEDFGQTLGVWGLGSGPYLVLPFFGPSSVRDGFGFVADFVTDPVDHISHVPTRNTTMGVRLISVRADFLNATGIFANAALDRYTFTRDAYLQRRLSAVYDGNPPEPPAPVPATE
jgi:phospholipid-binding lipoprotein MlaA